MPKITISTGVSGKAIGLSRLDCRTNVQHLPTVPPRSPRAEAIKPPSLAQAVEAYEPGSTVTTPLDSLQNRYAQNVMKHMKNEYEPGSTVAIPLDSLQNRYAQNVMKHMKNEKTPSQRHIKLHRHESLSRRDAA